MGILGGVTKDIAKATERDIAKGVEKDVAKGAEKAVSKATEKGYNKAFMVGLAAVPVVGVVVTSMLAADTAQEALDILKDHPEVIVILGGVALFIVLK